jgi:hypothetical protein
LLIPVHAPITRDAHALHASLETRARRRRRDTVRLRRLPIGVLVVRVFALELGDVPLVAVGFAVVRVFVADEPVGVEGELLEGSKEGEGRGAGKRGGG